MIWNELLKKHNAPRIWIWCIPLNTSSLSP